jgi:hypothetical protein
LKQHANLFSLTNANLKLTHDDGDGGISFLEYSQTVSGNKVFEGQVQVVYSPVTQQEVSVASPARFGWLDGAIRVDDSPAQVGCQIDPVLDLPNEFVKHWAMEVRLGT